MISNTSHKIDHRERPGAIRYFLKYSTIPIASIFTFFVIEALSQDIDIWKIYGLNVGPMLLTFISVCIGLFISVIICMAWGIGAEILTEMTGNQRDRISTAAFAVSGGGMLLTGFACIASSIAIDDLWLLGIVPVLLGFWTWRYWTRLVPVV